MTEPEWLTLELVRALHEELIAEHGGLSGERDEGLPVSALNRPVNLFVHEDTDLPVLAAAYAFGLSQNHPFIDGNKRIALAAIDVFLQLNGWELTAPEHEAVAMILDLSAGEIGEAEIADWVSRNVAKADD